MILSIRTITPCGIALCKARLDVPCTVLVRAYVNNCTRAERLCCSAATLILASTIALAVYFAVFYNKDSGSPDKWPWYIPRDTWLAAARNNSEVKQDYQPVRLVVIQHTVSSECYNFDKCAAEIRNLQCYWIKDKKSDIPYNFMIGNDGRVYEGRGWQKVGAHTKGYNSCSVGIGFIGDYRKDKSKVTTLQQERTQRLLDEGVDKGILHPKYQVVAAKDVRESESPGSNLIDIIKTWPHYDHQHRFKNKTCAEINNMIK